MNKIWTDDRLEELAQQWASLYPISGDNIQGSNNSKTLAPVMHTVYGGAHLYKTDTVTKLQSKARESFTTLVPEETTLAKVFNIHAESQSKTTWLTHTVYQKIKHRLEGASIQDFRIDFEDGFGPRPSAEEDFYAQAAADALANTVHHGLVPCRIGIRIKSMGNQTRQRALRTLTLFLGRFISQCPLPLPNPFIVTLPKVEFKSEPADLNQALTHLESEFGLVHNSIKMELMVESPLALMDSSGVCPLPSFAEACKERLLGVHLGAYDLTAGMDVPGPFQDLSHPACVYARTLMKAAFGSSSIELADGASHLIPIGEPSDIQSMWGRIYQHVRRSLSEGYYHGWDIHPAQIPPRYAALYTFFLDHQENTTRRLKQLLETYTKASRVGVAFDDAASGSGLLNFFRKGFSCGAFASEDLKAAGLSIEDLQVPSVAHLLARTN